jgi:hypothetical protein
VAVAIDTRAFLDSIPATLLEASRRLLSDGCVGELAEAGGGAQAVVRDGSHVCQPWVGIVDRTFAAECDCPCEQDDLCVHAVAVALAALDDGFAWSGAATPPSTEEAAPERSVYLAAAGRLAPRQLSALVVEQATQDRLFAATLLRWAGMLDAPDDEAVTQFRNVIRYAADVTNQDRWELSDIVAAGNTLVSEVQILTVRPATLDMLDLIEEAIIVWDGLSTHLHDAYRVRTTDPDEIGDPLADAHLRVCEQLALDPIELAHRLAELIDKCGFDLCLDAPDAYVDLLGDDGMDAFEQARP